MQLLTLPPSPALATSIRATAQVLAHLLRNVDIARSVPGQTREVLTRLQPGDIAILVRSNTDLDAYEAGLRAFGLPVKRDTGARFFQQPEVVATAHFLDLLLHHPDDALLALCLDGPYLRDINLRAEETMRLQDGAHPLALSTSFARTHPERHEHLLRFSRHLKTDPVPQFLARIYQETGILDHYRSTGRERSAFHLEHLREVARRLAVSEQALTPAGFLGWLRTMILTDQDLDMPDINNTAENPTSIPILTIHRAKGLEYPVVLLPEVQKDLRQDYRLPEFVIERDWGLDVNLPDLKRNPVSTRYTQVIARFKREQVQEEMRVLYVGATRAQRALYFIGSSSPTGGSSSAPPSWQKELLRAGFIFKLPPRERLPFASSSPDGKSTGPITPS